MSDASPSPLDTSIRYSAQLLDGRTIELRRMQRWDRHEVLVLLRAIDAHARLLLPDVDDAHGIDRWIADVESGRVSVVLASAGTRIVACASMRRIAVPWMHHIGEVSIAFSSGWASVELAEVLWRELMASVTPLGLRKLVAMMPHGQAEERAIAEHLGFSVEARLADQLIDGSGQVHDLLIMTRQVRAAVVFVRQECFETGAGARRRAPANGTELPLTPLPLVVGLLGPTLPGARLASCRGLDHHVRNINSTSLGKTYVTCRRRHGGADRPRRWLRLFRAAFLRRSAGAGPRRLRGSDHTTCREPTNVVRLLSHRQRQRLPPEHVTGDDAGG